MLYKSNQNIVIILQHYPAIFGVILVQFAVILKVSDELRENLHVIFIKN
jgi:hypothetical protein